MKTEKLITAILLTLLINYTHAQRVSVSGTKFLVNGKEIIMNGANTPWNKWNDFGGGYVSSWWDAEFQRIKNAGGNSTRIWISCNGDVGLKISSDGTVTGATNSFWSHLEDMFRLAEKNKIYIKATLISFDHFKNSYSTYQSWRNMVLSNEKVESFIENYVNPFVSKYKNNPYLWSIDVCNEIEWVNQNAECGNIPWARLQYLVARTASAVHDSSQVLVTLGSAAIKWNSPKYEGNFWSDANLKAQYNKPNAKLDFYSPHFYGWVVKWFGNFAVDKSPADYGINDRPCVIGENPAKGVYNDAANPTLVVPASEMFIGAYNKGWKGLMPWTSNGVDANGNLNDFKDGLKAFKDAHPELIDPSVVSGMAPQLNQKKYALIENIYKVQGNKQMAVVISDYENVILRLSDTMGRIVFQKKAESSNTLFPTENLTSGVYILAANKKGVIETRKFILY
ncbi:MAG TPA: T9SS type A sorting domain-containing protein [Draconibacterium sp.]|nr:T9SS type A sorting domain-containing protein [Draconibacterium sp.]